MDVARLFPPRRLTLPVANRWGAGEMAVLDFGDARRPVDLVFVHANGFNAATYRSLLALLSASLRILAPDLRGHGRTRLPTTLAGRWSWADHRDDLVSLLDGLEGPPVALAGHSMGATSALLAAAERPGRVSRAVLFDPVILDRTATAAFGLPLLRRLPRRYGLAQARRRRETFDSREQALEAYRGRGAFQGWPEMMLADYVSEGFVDRDGGDVALACSPAWEAANYAAQSHNPWRALKRLDRPVQILKAERGSTCSVAPGSRGLARVTVATVAGGTHFFPMLMPETARDALFDAAV